jgi:hypothetical protein
MTIKIVAYDNRLIMVNDATIGRKSAPSPFLSAGRFVHELIEDLAFQSRKCKRDQLNGNARRARALLRPP